MMSRFFNHKLALCGLVIILVISAFSFSAPLICRYQPDDIDIGKYLMPPTSEHWLGTDLLGRDLFSRIAYGGRISLSVGFIAVGLMAVVGICFGALAGYYAGKIDELIMRFVDIMFCFPRFILILAIISMLGPNIFIVMAVIGLTSWMGISRLVRAEILSLKERDFVLAARASGVNDFKIIIRHLIPNSMGPVFVSATLGVAAAILLESSLSFLGLGVQPPTPSWGNILMDAKACLGVAWWLSVFPGLAIFFTVLGYNLLGEGLRDLLVPRK
ncbi:MAG: ABC transporter permease [Candidatus Omnitrophica bacterium]|nr:ABC transporter permease [Candidatus Omnitrophota bacterium]MBU1925542.1 ABC transporter permease [Candidatus Omnitrophota bacterium]